MQNPNIIVMLTLTKLTSGISRSLAESRSVLLISFFISSMSANSLALGREMHGVHTHGVANLTLAFENGTLEVQFESPAMSLLGFEHTPETPKQIETIEKAKTLLSSSMNVISIGGADCSSDKVSIDILGPAGQALIHGSVHDQGHSHHPSKQQHVENKPSSVSHSEVIALYGFDCTDNSQSPSVSISLFDHFSGLEKINVNWVTATQQGSVVLSPESSTFELR